MSHMIIYILGFLITCVLAKATLSCSTLDVRSDSTPVYATFNTNSTILVLLPKNFVISDVVAQMDDFVEVRFTYHSINYEGFIDSSQVQCSDASSIGLGVGLAFFDMLSVIVAGRDPGYHRGHSSVYSRTKQSCSSPSTVLLAWNGKYHQARRDKGSQKTNRAQIRYYGDF